MSEDTGTQDDQIHPGIVEAIRDRIEASGMTTEAFIAAYNALTPEQIRGVFANPFHSMYVRSVEARRRLVAALSSGDFTRAADGITAADDICAGELLGWLAEFANWTGNLTRRLEEIRRENPAVWQAWEQAWHK